MTEEVRDWWEARADGFQDDIDMNVGINWTGQWAPDVEVDFLRADVTDLGMFADESFDVAFNAWVFQWVGDLAACFAETYRVLRLGGRFVFSMPHPFYGIVDPESLRVTGSYFDTGRQVTSHDGMDVDQVTYRHSVSGVHNALRRAGFEIERLLEPGTDDPDAYGSGPWGEFVPELLHRVPSVLIVDASKPHQ